MSTTTTTAITISLISNADCVKNGFLLIMIRAAIYGVHLGWQLISEFRHGLHVDGIMGPRSFAIVQEGAQSHVSCIDHT